MAAINKILDNNILYEICSATSYVTVPDFVKEWNILNDIRGEALVRLSMLTCNEI